MACRRRDVADDQDKGVGMRFTIRNALENTAKRTKIGNEIFGVSIGFASEVNQVAVPTVIRSR